MAKSRPFLILLLCGLASMSLAAQTVDVAPVVESAPAPGKEQAKN